MMGRDLASLRAIMLVVAGLAGSVLLNPARAQYYGYPAYLPYDAYPYPDYPPAYYAPPVIIYVPRPLYRPAPLAQRRFARVRHRRVVHSFRQPFRRGLVNPLLGPLPGPPSHY